MIADPHPEASRQDTAEVRAFFEQWSLYRRIVELDYLHHRAAYAAIDHTLSELRQPFSFLDLGSGDAVCTSRILANKPLASYEAVDLSETALSFARENTAYFRCPVRCTQGDFFQFVRKCRQSFDVVFIGLSFHHLMAEDKRRFLRDLRRITNPGGRLLIYEPFCEPGELPEESLSRWWKFAQTAWSDLTPEELRMAREHVFSSDHPELIATYITMMEDAGFGPVKTLYTDPQHFYSVIEAGA